MFKFYRNFIYKKKLDNIPDVYKFDNKSFFVNGNYKLVPIQYNTSHLVKSFCSVPKKEYDDKSLIKFWFKKSKGKIIKHPELHHLLSTDIYQDSEYCSHNTVSTEFNHLQKCVTLTSKYKFLHEYIELYLLLHPEVIDYQNKKGWTALMIAACNSNYTSTEKTIKILLKRKANINIVNNDGYTALMCVANDRLGYVGKNTTEMLLKYRADINVQTSRGWTALMLATANHSYYADNNTIKNMIELFIKYNANVNLKNCNGQTALMCAVLNYAERNYTGNNPEIVKLLLDHGSDINLKEVDEHTALTLSIIYSKHHNETIIKMLLEKMDHCDVEVKGQKLIKYIWDAQLSDEIIELAIKKGAKLSDIFDVRTIRLIKQHYVE